MEGSDAHPGLNRRSLTELFSVLAATALGPLTRATDCRGAQGGLEL